VYGSDVIKACGRERQVECGRNSSAYMVAHSFQATM
jgi:hypothetical protein